MLIWIFIYTLSFIQDWALRSEEQSLLIERILVLIRNVLQVPSNPEAECRTDNDASLHDQVIWALHQSGILDMILYIISSADEHQFHLHCLEILCLLYREQTAENLAEASMQRSLSEKQRDEQELMAARRREKQRLTAKLPPVRHSRFGGTYVIRNLKSVSDRDIICHQPLERVVSIDFDREKQQQKRSHRHVHEEAQVTRRSAFSVRLCLREYCIEILSSAYNTLVRQVRRVLERNVGTNNHDDSFLLWAVRFFLEFNRLSDMKLELVSESLSVQCFHWVLTRMEHDMDMIVSDKKQARLWAKRLHVALQTFRELLHSLVALQKLKDNNAQALFDMLVNNVCYVLEYRETILHLLMNYNEAHSTKAFLRDVVETANIFIKIMEKFCKDSVVVQDKKRLKKRLNKKKKTADKHKQETEEELSNRWVEMADEITQLLTNDLQLAEEDQPIPFDTTSDKSIDDQREDCLIRIHKLLRARKLDHAIALMRAAREVWPENDVFGAMSAAPEDELLLMREIFMHNISTDDPNENIGNQENSDESDEEENEELEAESMVEKPFKFDDFAKRLLNPKIVRACVIVLSDWEQIPSKSLRAAVTILHRIGYGCSCPAMLYQAKLFRIFQQVFHAARDTHHEELRRLGIYIVRKFVETAPANPKIYAELLFNKNIKEANELETGYCDAYERGTKGSWTEEQEAELRFLFEENQRNPETDKDVIDWILDNLIDKTRTRRGILKKLKELGLMFKAPTKKSTNMRTDKNLWGTEEDEQLRSLYDQYRVENDCLQKILDDFEGRRNKQQVIKRMLQLHLIADKSEIMPEKPKRAKSKKKQNSEIEDFDAEEELTEGISQNGEVLQNRNRKPAKPRKHKTVRAPLDIGTVKSLLSQVDQDTNQEALNWLRECLDDAAEDIEEPSEEDDGVPLLPLQEIQKQAMEDENFQKLLLAFGVQPPVLGMESYWRIPIYLNSADLKLRSKIIAGEEIPDETEDVKNDNNEDDNANGEEIKTADDSDEENDDRSDYLTKQREKLNTLLFSKSDEETEERLPLKSKTKKEKNKKKLSTNIKKKKKKLTSDSEGENDAQFIAKIQKKLNKKKRNQDLSSDEEENEGEEGNAADMFDQLKNARATKKNSLNTWQARFDEKSSDDNDDDEDNGLLNFNSEDYRKRLAELGDSSNEEEEEEGANNEIKAKPRKIVSSQARRANVIESESDSDKDDNELEAKNNTINNNGTGSFINPVTNTQQSNNQTNITLTGVNDDVDSVEEIMANKKGRHLRTHSTSNADTDRDNNTNSNDGEQLKGGDGKDEQFKSDEKSAKRHYPTRDDEEDEVEDELLKSNAIAAKRRRLAIIDDDDD
ncbi:protein timeless homolog [Glossina fuscipes]|uniref:Protein timeless homolog n=2 Tax=Nemorhina TaxID=44051 RepID=A0A9C5Z816_9MUSC|nr:protein timeless homolog [Glossina fuscipes]